MLTVCKAQIVTASISGMVVDPRGAAAENASISLVHKVTGALRRTVSDATGHFLLARLDAGHFKLTISKTGFKALENPTIILSTGDRLWLGRVLLELGAVTEALAVTAQPALVQTYSAEHPDVITSRQVAGLRVRGGDGTDLLVLLPGVLVASQPEDLKSGPNFYVQGNRRTMNNVALDRVPSTDMGNDIQLNLLVSQRAVAEVNILVSNCQAEYRRMPGSNLQIVTKSGTGEFHGLGSFFKRHEQLNANNFFNNRNEVPKRRYRYNIWTYNVGGPVFVPRKFNRDRDKLFFCRQQEFWPTKSASTGRVTVTIELERQVTCRRPRISAMADRAQGSLQPECAVS